MNANPNNLINQGYSKITDRFFINKSKSLGSGTYGQVFLGYDNLSNSSIAVKTILKSKLSKSQTNINEIEILKKLKHPNIIEFYDSHGVE